MMILVTRNSIVAEKHKYQNGFGSYHEYDSTACVATLILTLLMVGPKPLKVTFLPVSTILRNRRTQFMLKHSWELPSMLLGAQISSPGSWLLLVTLSSNVSNLRSTILNLTQTNVNGVISISMGRWTGSTPYTSFLEQVIL